MITAPRASHRKRGRRRERGDPFAECDPEGRRECPALAPGEWAHDATALKKQKGPWASTTRIVAIVYDRFGRGRHWPGREPG